MPRHTDCAPGRSGLKTLALLAVLFLVAPAQADLKKDTSLGAIPADAAFYSASLRNKEQIDLFYKSNAYKTLRALPLVKEAYDKAMKELKREGGPLDNLKPFLDDKNTKELIDLVLEGAGDEVFLYGGNSWVGAFELLMKINNAQQFSGLDLIGGNEPQKAQARNILRALQKDRAKFKVPELVVGIKFKDEKKAEKHVDRLFKMAEAAIKANDDLQGTLGGKLKKATIAGGPFMMLALDGGMIPADKLAAIEDFEEEKGEFTALINHIKTQKLTLSFGAMKGRLVLGLTSTTKELETLVAGGKLLADRAELKPVLANETKKITGINYLSASMRKAMAGNMNDLADALIDAKKKIAKIQQLKEERREAIGKDLEALAADLRKFKVPEVGAVTAFSYMTSKGYESFSHDYGDHSALKGVKCNLLRHFGGDPIFASAYSFPCEGESYKFASKYAGKIWGHVETIFLDSADEDNKKKFQDFAKTFVPLMKKLDDTTKKQLLPSMKDAGIGIVLDGKWTSAQWHQGLPKTEKPLAMLELGLLLGINEATKFTSAMTEYRKTINELFDLARATNPNENNIRDLKVPLPEKVGSKNGKLYVYSIPEAAGLDGQFAPTAGVGESVAVLTLSKKHTERLLAETSLKIKSAPLSRKGDIIGGAVFNNEALVDLALPWIEFNIKMMTPLPKDDQEGEKKAREKMEQMIRQVRVVAQVFKAFKRSSSATYLEGKALVTQTEAIIEDLPGVVQVKE